MSTLEQMASVLERIAGHIEEHRTTLVFVNTRRMAERVAHQLADRLGEDSVQAHHGSLSMDRRLRVEARLRAGELRAVVATASLELGIDVGPVELVCQLGSPRSIATFLQRVGRAQHHVGGVPVGRLYPLTRDELVECTALLASVRVRRSRRRPARRSRPSTSSPSSSSPSAPPRIPRGVPRRSCSRSLARSAPYSGLGAEDFEAVVELVSRGRRHRAGPARGAPAPRPGERRAPARGAAPASRR